MRRASPIYLFIYLFIYFALGFMLCASTNWMDDWMNESFIQSGKNITMTIIEKKNALHAKFFIY